MSLQESGNVEGLSARSCSATTILRTLNFQGAEKETHRLFSLLSTKFSAALKNTKVTDTGISNLQLNNSTLK